MNVDIEQVTPMMRQYLEIKEQNKDAILFFRLGDFYEMFNEDAKVASEELDLTQALLEGFKQREIAENLGVSQQAVAARLRKIRDKLKGIIASM